MMLDNVATPICLSGGAPGADLEWGLCARAAGHTVIHWSFVGHRTKAPLGEHVILPTELQHARHCSLFVPPSWQHETDSQNRQPPQSLTPDFTFTSTVTE